MWFLLLLIPAFFLAVIIFMRLPKFGRIPTGERMKEIEKSPEYKNGEFKNLEHTPDFTNGATFWKVSWYFLFYKNRKAKPPRPLPNLKTDLHKLAKEKNTLVWFGHSGYFMQVGGKKILVDPVFSGAASPVKFTTRSFKGSDVYTADDIPEIDYLLLTHDHWDHLDYETIRALKPKVKKIVTSMGVGAHLERWGIDPKIVTETQWGDEVILGDGFKIDTTPARHFSGRGFKRAQSLWSSFVLTTPVMRVFVGGDSGYGEHFKRIGNEFGPFDLAIMECGQYNDFWQYIHASPEEVIKASKDLKAAKTLPVHWGKFALSKHDWDDPIKRVTKAAEKENFTLFTPMIGEAMDMNNFTSTRWWEKVV
jgi:L-ascorbate metabolism protein UlaG (beta-lactamase superfamily)